MADSAGYGWLCGLKIRRILSSTDGSSRQNGMVKTWRGLCYLLLFFVCLTDRYDG